MEAPEDRAARRIALFDLDRTLTRFGTFTPFLLFAAGTRPWRLLLLPVMLAHMLRYKAGAISRKDLKSKMIGLFLSGLSRSRTETLAQAFAAGPVRWGLRRSVIERLEAHRANGDILIVATAAMDFYVRAIAERLGIRHAIATRGIFDSSGRLTSGVEGENCYGAAKAEMVRSYLQSAGLDGIPAIFYTDHHTDAPAAALAQRTIAVAPRKKMRALAATHGWEVIPR